MLTDPNTRLRKMPLGISYPLRHEQEIVVLLPDGGWDLPPLETSVESEAFSFHYRRKSSGSSVRFEYDCETKVPTVPAEKVADYLKKLEEMHDLLQDTLYRAETGTRAILAQMNWLMVVVAGFGSAAALAGGLWIWRATRLTEAAPAGTLPPLLGEPRLQGLGGWLVVVAFGLFASLVWRPISLAQNWEDFFSSLAWQAVAVPGAEHYHPLYGPLLIFEVLGNVLLLGLTVLAVCLFFARRRVFPRIYITMLVANVLFLLVDKIVGGRIPHVVEASHGSSMRGLWRAALPAIIWCSYMLTSRRVKATFVR